GSLRRAQVAASTCARLCAMGAAISASTPSAFEITSRRCAPRLAAGASARPFSRSRFLENLVWLWARLAQRADRRESGGLAREQRPPPQWRESTTHCRSPL